MWVVDVVGAGLRRCTFEENGDDESDSWVSNVGMASPGVSEPEGVLVCMNPDAEVKELLENWKEAADISSSERASAEFKSRCSCASSCSNEHGGMGRRTSEAEMLSRGWLLYVGI